MKDTNVFNHIICPWRYPSNWFKNIRAIGRGIKWSYQRITKGYCDKDVWGLDDAILNYLYGTLKQLSKDSSGWPDGDFKEPEDWSKFLDELADYFYRANLWNDSYTNEYKEDFYNEIDKLEDINKEKDPVLVKKYFDREKEIYDLKRQDLKEGFKKLEEHFYQLWD